MRVGLIARCDDRGIAYQTHEAWRHYPFASTLLVMMGDPAWPEHPERFEGAVPVHFEQGTLQASKAGFWMRDLDVVFAVETVYDWRMMQWAKATNTKVVIQGNPELYKHAQHPEMPEPDLWTWPTNWMLDEIPAGPVIPVPVPDDAPRMAAPYHSDRFVVLHVAGHRAVGDRNGTDLFVEALQYIESDVEVRIVGQDGELPKIPDFGRNVDLRVNPHGELNRWDLYRDVNLVVLPRRYGGLCLPAQEALAAGCAVAMTDCAPNTSTWPIFAITASKGPNQRVPFGFVGTHIAKPEAIAHAIDRLNIGRGRLRDLVEAGAQWVEEHRWSKLKNRYDDLFRSLV